MEEEEDESICYSKRMKEEEREEEEGTTKLLDHRFLDPNLLLPCGPTAVQSLHHQL
jgi:hypothetical protein